MHCLFHLCPPTAPLSLLQTMWIERTTYVTAYSFPGILKWFEVKSVSVVRDRNSLTVL